MARNRDTVFDEYKTFNILNPIQQSEKSGVFAMSTTSLEKYKSNLYTLLFTGVGQRVAMPNFGTRIMQLLFEPLTENVYTDLKEEIINKTEFWIPEIKITDVEFKDQEDELDNNRINMRISFSLKQDETIEDFVELEMST